MDREPTASPQDEPSRPEASYTLVLGLGNDILGDDAIGLRVIRALAEHLGDHPRIALKESSEMGLALLDLVAGFDDLLVVDAIPVNLAVPGALHRMSIGDLATLAEHAPVSPHFFGVGEMLRLGRELGLSVPRRVRVFAVEIHPPYRVSTEMSPELEAALPRLVREVLDSLTALKPGL